MAKPVKKRAPVKRSTARKHKRNLNGLRWDTFDERDYVCELPSKKALKALPASYDMESQCPEMLDQGALGSCVWNAISNLLRFTGIETAKAAYVRSRLLGYYFGRVKQGTVNEDSGLSVRVGMQVWWEVGACDERLWPYVIKDFKKKPSAAAIKEANKNKAPSKSAYARVPQTKDGIKACLSANNPFVFGFDVPNSFMRIGKDGILKLVPNEKYEGGHCVMAVAYDDNFKFPNGEVGGIKIMNSWGKGWGKKGFAWMPYSLVLDPRRAGDMWTAVAVA